MPHRDDRRPPRRPAGGRSRGKDASNRGGRRDAPTRRRRDLSGAAADLPGWVIAELERATPRERVAAALHALGEATQALADGRFRAALRWARRAKDLAPRDATVRETLGLAAYRSSDWKTALRELRTYRRMTGETTHLPVEMDCLRALGRGEELQAAWTELRRRRSRRRTIQEGKVVYASHLLDQGKADEAWEIVGSERLRSEPDDWDLRVWYVAARAAAARGDTGAARRLRDEILRHDPSFPGLDELDAEIAAADPS